jgi:dTDP-4-amino-4,6-dideoxygalactose transaminase
VFSLHPVKIITTGEDGMAMTNHPGLYEHMVRLRSHGITRDPRRFSRDPKGAWYYEQLELGFNYRIDRYTGFVGPESVTDHLLSTQEKVVLNI